MADITYIPIRQLHPHPDNPRKELGDLSELSASIKENGVYQNLTVIPGHYLSSREYISKCVDEGGDNKGGGNTASNVSSTTDYLFLLSEYEVFATHQYCNDAEPNYQAQYDYFKAGNSKVANKHSATGTAAVWWRSPYYIDYTTTFCAVSSSGSLDYYYAGHAFGVVPGFVV